MNILVTGGAGFIGSALIRHIIAATEHTVLNVDKLTYAGNLDSVEAVSDNPRYGFTQADIADHRRMAEIFGQFQPDIVINLAAESHVDRSIDDPLGFMHSNVTGVYALLDVTRHYLAGLSATRKASFRFHQVSSDEVYGDLQDAAHHKQNGFSEQSRYCPSTPYAASKAAADHLVRAWHRTYRVPILISTSTNNYGPYQYPEKLIPLMILKALRGEALPVYGDGCQVRDWLHVDDHARALLRVALHGQPGETYNIGANCTLTNLELVEMLCDLLDATRPRDEHYQSLIQFVTDRPGHDVAYALDTSKINSQLKWQPRIEFKRGLEQTIDWYLSHLDWCQQVQKGHYAGERLGRL